MVRLGRLVEEREVGKGPEVVGGGRVGLGGREVLALVLREPVALALERDELDPAPVQLVVPVEQVDVRLQVGDVAGVVEVRRAEGGEGRRILRAVGLPIGDGDRRRRDPVRGRAPAVSRERGPTRRRVDRPAHLARPGAAGRPPREVPVAEGVAPSSTAAPRPVGPPGTAPAAVAPGRAVAPAAAVPPPAGPDGTVACVRATRTWRGAKVGASATSRLSAPRTAVTGR